MLVLTDVASGWTECTPLVVYEQSLLIEALKAVDAQLLIPLLGTGTDNDSVFVNETVVGFCTGHHIEFIRSRAYLTNDQACIAQKNGSIVRRFVCEDHSTPVPVGQRAWVLHSVSDPGLRHALGTP